MSLQGIFLPFLPRKTTDRETISYLRGTGKKSGKGSEMDGVSTPGYQPILNLGQKVEPVLGGLSRQGTRESQRVANAQTWLWAKGADAQTQQVQSPLLGHQGILLTAGQGTKDWNDYTRLSRKCP